MHLVTCDPSSTTHYGFCTTKPGEVWLDVVTCFRPSTTGLHRTRQERLVPLLQERASGADVLGIEIPPAQANADTGTAFVRGVITLPLGRAMMAVESIALDLGLRVVLLPVMEWRQVMEPLAVELGVVAEFLRAPVVPVAPKKKPRATLGKPRRGKGTTLVFPYTGCSHTVEVSFEAAQRDGVAPRCVVCSAAEARPAAPSMTPAEARRDEFKRKAYVLACALHPEPMHRLLVSRHGDDAGTHPTPWRLTGVSDVAEAAVMNVALRRQMETS